MALNTMMYYQHWQDGPKKLKSFFMINLIVNGIAYLLLLNQGFKDLQFHIKVCLN